MPMTKVATSHLKRRRSEDLEILILEVKDGGFERCALLSNTEKKGKDYSLSDFLVWFFLGIGLVSITLTSYWSVIYLGLYERGVSCSEDWDTTLWCPSHVMHKELQPPPYSIEHWVELRRIYQQSVERSSLGAKWDQLFKEGEDGKIVENTGFLVPVNVSDSPGKGKGVFASKPIKNGQKLWDNRYRGVFDNECSARKFFNVLSEEEACSGMFWGYTNNFYGRGFQFMLDLDGHGYINDCAEEDRNVQHHFDGEVESDDYRLPRFFFRGIDDETMIQRNDPGAYGLYATRDIEEGEELCFPYSEVAMNGYGFFDWYTFFVCRSLPLSEWWTI
jgi:hypothetical protein